MKLPLWLVALALGYWGWEVGILALAIPMAVLAAGPLAIPHRFGLSRTEFHRALDVCWVLGFGGLLLVYSRESVGNVFRTFAQWLPAVAFPGLLAQVWSVSGRVPASAIVPLPRWRRRSGDSNPPMDLAPPYVAVCLLSISAAGGGRPWFYPGLVILGGLLLWMRRPPGARVWATAILFAVATVSGWFVSQGLAAFQQWVENGVFVWSSQLQREGGSYRFSRTAIGRTGRVGGSDLIVLKIRDRGPRPMPLLFRVASYSTWADGTWSATGPSVFEKIEGTADEWLLEPRRDVVGAIDIEWVRGSTDGLLPLPGTTFVLRDLLADTLERTGLGAVRPNLRAGVVSLRAEHAAATSWESEPVSSDSSGIPEKERGAVEAVVGELGLKNRPAREVIQQLRDFFRSRFKYTTDIRDAPAADARARTALGRFLLGHRTGHCEYFATAAVLLLRASGLPTRYATGFLVQPDLTEGGVVTVRESQGHAWARVWLDRGWVDFDPTPPVDFSLEPERTWMGRLAKQWYEFRFEVARWWWLGEKRLLRQAYWLAAPLLVGLLWRFRQLRASSGASRHQTGPNSVANWPGLDSEWLSIDSILRIRGWSRRDEETRERWGERLAGAGWDSGAIRHAETATALHERLRFDPHGLDPEERRSLRRVTGEVHDFLVRRAELPAPRGAAPPRESAGTPATGGSRSREKPPAG